MNKKILTLCMCLLPILSGKAQFGLWYNQGVVDNDYVWMASSNGLVRYDKVSGESRTFPYTQFKEVASVIISPTGEIVVGGAARDPRLATFDGISFCPLDIGITHYVGGIWSLAYHDGLWAGSNGYLFHYSNSGLEEYEQPLPILSNHAYVALTWSEKLQRMWFAVIGNAIKGHLGYVDSAGIHYIEEARSEIYDFIEQDDGSLLLATSFGLQKYADGKIEDIAIPYYIDPVYGITAIVRKEDAIWFGTKEYLICYDGNRFKDYQWHLVNDLDYISDIIPDKDGVLWIIFRQGGLVKFQNGEFTQITSGISNAIPDSDSNDGEIYSIRGLKLNNAPKNQILIRNGKKYMNTNSTH